MQDLVYFYPQGHEAHSQPGHPERPERIEAIRAALQKAGWWETYSHLGSISIPERVLHTVHTPEYLKTLQAACNGALSLDMDTYTTNASWDLALKAAGGGIAVASAVWRREARRGFALTRPPGHHATHSRGMGFCLLNNVALSAEYLLQEEGAQRLSIVDLDLHHGNGTQDIFWKRLEVLYISTHQYPYYPGTGSLTDQGAGLGTGTKVNLPLPAYSGDRAYLTCMANIILPILDRYKPQALLVSVGFDPHWRDPIGEMLLSAGAYKELIDNLVRWADQSCEGRIALFLEGGYDLEASAACALACVASLTGRSWKDPLGAAPYSERSGWQSVIQQACDLWDLPAPHFDS
jgi:acetoin utilization deacetylase AcuC-like enzyme